MQDHLIQTYIHDWSNDPYSLGAYSYILVNGIKGWQKAKEIEQTLFFSGEGLATGSSRGTVHGAFVSGISAAEKVIQSLKTK